MRVIPTMLGPREEAKGIPVDEWQKSRTDLSYHDQAPVLVAGSSDAAFARARRTIEAAGHRVGACVPVAEAQQRIALQISSSAVWVELDEDCGGPMDALLTGISDDVAAGRYGAVVSSTGALVDAVAARVHEPLVELVVDADDAERAVALAMAAGRFWSVDRRLSDVASDQNAARLRQLSEEVSRIAGMLSRLSAGPEAEHAKVHLPHDVEFASDVSAETVRSVIRARRLRAQYFAEQLFADPAWDMLLDLFQAEIAQLRVPVSSLCIAAAVPATTALRWLKTMVDEGIFVRRADPYDGRRVFVELAPGASDAMRRYFADVGKVAAI